MLTRDEIEWLYRCILGRKPESEEAIEINRTAFKNFTEARAFFLESKEFLMTKISAEAPDSFTYKPASWRAFVKSARRIGLACIVKDEASRITSMLNSALPLVDFIGIVDTGSIDDTQRITSDILEAWGGEYLLKNISFVDFAQARNQALALVPPYIEWVLVLDGDEHIVQEDYQRFTDLTEFSEVDAWYIPRFNFNDAHKKLPAAPYPDYQSRFFRNRVNTPIKYNGTVHETLLNVTHWGTAPAHQASPFAPMGGPHIHHMGQVALTRQRWEEKHAFYEGLAELGRLSLPCNAPKSDQSS